MKHRFVIADKQKTARELLIIVISSKMDDVTNPYSPMGQILSELWYAVRNKEDLDQPVFDKNGVGKRNMTLKNKE